MSGQERDVAPGWYRRAAEPDVMVYWDGTALVDSMRAPVAHAVEDIVVLTEIPTVEFWEVARVSVRVASALLARQPTLADVNGRLREKAATFRANAVVGVTYGRGRSLTSWRTLSAEGIAVVLSELPSRELAPGEQHAAQGSPVADRLRTLDELLGSGLISEEEHRTQRQRILDQI